MRKLTPTLKSRLDRYLSSGESHREAQYDIWKRHEDKLAAMRDAVFPRQVAVHRETNATRDTSERVDGHHPRSGLQQDGDIEMDGGLKLETREERDEKAV